MGRQWTVEEIRYLLAYHANGFKYSAIARRLNRTTAAVRTAIFYNRPRETVPSRNYKPGELKTKIKNLSLPGVSDSSIGKTLGLSKSTVRSIRERLGIPSRVSCGGQRKIK